MVKDDGAILCAGVVALAVQRRGIMRLPKRFDDFLVGSFRGIELDLDDFRVAGITLADLFVGRVFGVAACVTAGDGFDAGQHLEERFSTPEAAAAEGREFSRVGLHSDIFVCVSSGRRQCANRQQTADQLFHVDNHSQGWFG